MKLLQGKLTYANVVATLALFIALGGASAFAATQLGKNSVGTKQIKNGSITLAKLSAGAQQTLKGSPGTPGATGSQGPPGAPGATHLVVRVGPLGEPESKAECHPGEVATGGGGLTPGTKEVLFGSTPNKKKEGEVPTGWIADAETTEGTPAEVEAFVICASP
jgi:hypothetical protein